MRSRLSAVLSYGIITFVDVPFRDVAIFPSHSRRTAVVAWIVAPFLKEAEFYVYKKWDGGAEWELLSEEPTYGTVFADTNFVIRNKVDVPQYKVLALLDGHEYVSPDAALYAHTERKAFGIAQNIIRATYLQARQDGIPVLYYPAIRNGKMSSSLNDITGQREQAACPSPEETPEGEEDENDYGTYYAGGYYRPFLTFVRFIGQKIQRKNILDEGTFDESVQLTKFLAFPPVRTGDLVVDVTTDRRWLVGASIQANLVKSVIPVSYTGHLTLQSHNNPCYAVPIPTNYPYLVRQLTWPVIP